MTYDFTPQQLANILAFLNGDTSIVLDMEAAKQLVSISAALTRAVLQENYSLKGRNRSLERQAERNRERRENEKALLVSSGEFDCTGIDSEVVAWAFLYLLQQRKVLLTKEKFRILVYLVYASWLYHRETRLFVETPRAIESGPIFWSLNSKITNVVTPVGYDRWKALTEKSPAVAAFLSSYVEHGVINASEGDLLRMAVQSAPVKTAMETARKNGKKTWEISDKDIWIWKDNQKKGK